MRMPNVAKAFQAFSSLMAEKQSISAQECMAVEKLNRALNRTGYRIIPLNPQPHRTRRGRPRGSRNGKPRLRSVSVNGVHKVEKRGPGRPSVRRAA
jgi:hypothetical protein